MGCRNRRGRQRTVGSVCGVTGVPSSCLPPTSLHSNPEKTSTSHNPSPVHCSQPTVAHHPARSTPCSLPHRRRITLSLRPALIRSLAAPTNSCFAVLSALNDRDAAKPRIKLPPRRLILNVQRALTFFVVVRSRTLDSPLQAWYSLNSTETVSS